MTEGPHVKDYRRKQADAHQKALYAMMRQEWGRALILSILDSPIYCGTDDTMPHGDALEMAYRNGRRDVGLQLRKAVQSADFELYVRMLGEQANQARLFLNAQRNDAEGVKFEEK
jgi:hypothetical protein